MKERIQHPNETFCADSFTNHLLVTEVPRQCHSSPHPSPCFTSVEATPRNLLKKRKKKKDKKGNCVVIQRITACREITVYTSSPGTEAGASCCAAGAHPAAQSSIQRGLHRSATAAPAALCSHGSGSGREGHSPQTCPEPGVLCPLGCFPSVTPACSHVSVSAELSHRCCPPAE